MKTIATFHELRIRRRELLNDLDKLETSVAELTVALHESIEADSDELADQRDPIAWLRRQQIGLLVMLNETERALLEFDADGWDE